MASKLTDRILPDMLSKLGKDPLVEVRLGYGKEWHETHHSVQIDMVGEHVLEVLATHNASSSATGGGKQGGEYFACYDVLIEIHDTDECEQSEEAEWMHECDPSARCVNQAGGAGYYCECKGAKSFAVPKSGEGKCEGGEKSSKDCCFDIAHTDWGFEGDYHCRLDFKCTAPDL